MADLKEARVPDIGHDGVPVIEVLVKAGDRVEKVQSLITLESDKATMEVPAPFAGVVKELKLKVGDEVSEGAVIALIETVGEADTASPPPASGEGRGEGTGARSGSDKTPSPSAEPEKNVPAPAPAAPPASATATAPAPAAAPPHPRPPVDASVVMPGDAPYASPAIRAFARELGVDIQQVKGSGRGGRI